MKSKLINYLKWTRLLIAVLMLMSIPYTMYMKKLEIYLPDKLIMTALLAFFVFFLGLEYHVGGKQKRLSFFLMLFSIMMLISVALGLMY